MGLKARLLIFNSADASQPSLPSLPCCKCRDNPVGSFLPKASGPRGAKAACALCLVGFSCRLSIPETQANSTLLGSLGVLRLKYSRTLLCLPHLATSSAVSHRFAAVWLQSDLSLIFVATPSLALLRVFFCSFSLWFL